MDLRGHKVTLTYPHTWMTVLETSVSHNSRWLKLGSEVGVNSRAVATSEVRHKLNCDDWFGPQELKLKLFANPSCIKKSVDV